MAITEDRPLALEAGTVNKVAERPLGALTRPQSDVGWASWFTTVDHKKILKGNYPKIPDHFSSDLNELLSAMI